jgi:class 3 adenylate cyclase
MNNSEKTLEQWAGGSYSPIALLLTDIIGSTNFIKTHGNFAWLEPLRRHFGRAREIRDRFEGREIKLIGDAYMVAFKTADKALQFARELIVNTGDSEIFIRAAIHVGDVWIFENDIYGVMVNFTARLIETVKDIPRNLEPSRIVVSDPAFNRIKETLGDEINADFRDYRARLRSFDEQRAWFYNNQNALAQLRERRNPQIKSETLTRRGRLIQPSITQKSQPMSQPPYSRPSTDQSPTIMPIRRFIRDPTKKED